MIGLGALNLDEIFSGHFLPIVIGMAFLWVPAVLADRFSGKDE